MLANSVHVNVASNNSESIEIEHVKFLFVNILVVIVDDIANSRRSRWTHTDAYTKTRTNTQPYWLSHSSLKQRRKKYNIVYFIHHIERSSHHHLHHHHHHRRHVIQNPSLRRRKQKNQISNGNSNPDIDGKFFHSNCHLQTHQFLLKCQKVIHTYRCRRRRRPFGVSQQRERAFESNHTRSSCTRCFHPIDRISEKEKIASTSELFAVLLVWLVPFSTLRPALRIVEFDSCLCVNV